MGVFHAKASSGVNPNPSYSERNTRTLALAYRSANTSSETYDWIVTDAFSPAANAQAARSWYGCVLFSPMISSRAAGYVEWTSRNAEIKSGRRRRLKIEPTNRTSGSGAAV